MRPTRSVCRDDLTGTVRSRGEFLNGQRARFMLLGGLHLEDRLGPEDEAAIASKVISLGVDLMTVSLDVDDR